MLKYHVRFTNSLIFRKKLHTLFLYGETFPETHRSSLGRGAALSQNAALQPPMQITVDYNLKDTDAIIYERINLITPLPPPPRRP